MLTLYPGAPDDDGGIDPLPTSGDPVCIDHLDGGVQADLNVQAFKGCLGIGDQLFVEAGKEVRPMRAFVGSIFLKSRFSAKRASSAIDPAGSTPVGPPPTSTMVSKRGTDERQAIAVVRYSKSLAKRWQRLCRAKSA
jgi:hypothetical protein